MHKFIVYFLAAPSVSVSGHYIKRQAEGGLGKTTACQNERQQGNV